MTKAASVVAQRTWLCAGCSTPRPETTAINVYLQDEEPSGTINFVNGHGISVIRRDILLSFGEIVIARDLYVGRVFNKDNREIAGWATFRAKQKVIIRGTKNVSCRKCAECGRIVYFANGPRYLCPAPQKLTVLSESDLFGMVIPEVLFKATQQNKAHWLGAQCDRISVLETPNDGLPVML